MLGSGAIEHGTHIVVVGIGFVNEAPAILTHGNEPGFCALHQMGKATESAIGARYPRHRGPRGGMGHVLCNTRADTFTQAQAIAGIAFGGRA